MEEIRQIWQDALKIMAGEISAVSFETWVEPAIPLRIEGDALVLQVENGFYKEMLEKRHLQLLRSAIRQAAKKEYDILILTEEEQKNGGVPKAVDLSEKRQENDLARNLNPKYIFDSFVVGNGNRMAHAASLAVAESPAQAYNPLFLYGNSGLGKTHLMHSIAHFILEKNPTAKVLYVTSETFTNELILSIQNNKNEEFRNKYRNIDVLLIDDIQFISEKTQTQEEFFHTFNELLLNNKQIVISSDRPPSEIKHLADRLVSRFQAGLVVDLKLPDFETRTAILQAKAKSLNYDIPNDVIQYIAQNIKSNIRELEGVLNRVIFYSKIYPGNITIDMAENAVEDIIKMNKPKISIDYIQEIVAAHYGFTTDDLKSKTRTKKLALARQVAMYLCRKMLDSNYKDIGRKFGNKDHSTVISAYNKIESLADEDDDIKNTLINLEKKINNQ